MWTRQEPERARRTYPLGACRIRGGEVKESPFRRSCFEPSALLFPLVPLPGPSGQAGMFWAVGAEEEEPTLRLWRGLLTQPPLRPKVSDTERTNAARMCVRPCPYLTGAQPWRAAAIQWPVGKPALRCADPGTEPGRATRYVTSPLWRGLLTKPPPPVARLPIPSLRCGAAS